MSQRSRARLKGRRNSSRGFSMLIHEYFTSAEYAQLSPRALKALVDLYTQFKGANNGDLCAAWTLMRRRGWTSKDQLGKAIAELLERGWISVTRQGGFAGGRHQPRLYAVTWLGIDYCGGKLDVRADPVPAMTWRRPATPAAPVIFLTRSTGQPDPQHGSVDPPENTIRPAARVGAA